MAFARRSSKGRRTTFPPGRRVTIGARSLTVMEPETGRRLYAGEIDPYPIVVPTVTLLALGTTTIPVRFMSRGGLLIKSIRASSTGAFSLRVTDDKNSQAWQNGALPSALVLGNGQRPYELPVPGLVRPNNALVLTIADTSAAGNAIDITFDCTRLDPSIVDERILALLEREMPYFQVAQLVLPAVAGGASPPVNLVAPTDADVDFEFWDWMASDFNWYAQMQSISDGTLVTSAPVRAGTLFGDAQYPGSTCGSLVVPGNETVQIVGINQTAAGRNVDVVLGGTKAWKP